jgi:uncharacterized membrane protein YkoI
MTSGPRSRPAAVLLLVALLAAAAPAWADHSDDFKKARDLRDKGEIVPFSEILEHTRAYHPGRVISVKFEEDDGRYVYELEVLDPEGVVWALLFDARTGDLMETLEESEEIRREKQEDRAADYDRAGD